MPLYDFKNEKTGEVRAIHFAMVDEKIYNGEDGSEVGIWKRVFHAPQMSVGSRIDPFSQKSFLDKSKNVTTYGEAWDLSKEFSDLRADKLGAPDPQRIAAEKKFYKPEKQNK